MVTKNDQAENDLSKPDTLAALLCCLYEGPEIQLAATMLIEQAMELEELRASPVAAPEAPTDGIRGPLTDAQRDDIRAFAATLHGGQIGAFDDIIRQASVAGYVNGRADFASTGVAPEAPATEQQAKCWSCKKPYTLEQHAEADGNCPHCGVEIELATPAATTASASDCPQCHGSESVSDPKGWQLERIPCPACTGRATAPSRNADELLAEIQSALDSLADTKMTTHTYSSMANVLHHCRDAITGKGYFGAALTQQSAAQPGGEE